MAAPQTRLTRWFDRVGRIFTAIFYGICAITLAVGELSGVSFGGHAASRIPEPYESLAVWWIIAICINVVAFFTQRAIRRPPRWSFTRWEWTWIIGALLATSPLIVIGLLAP